MGIEQFLNTEVLEVEPLPITGERDAYSQPRKTQVTVAGKPRTILRDRYDVLSKIKKGSHASIFKVRDLITKDLLALKVLHDNAHIDQYTTKRFENEFAYLESLDHRNIVKAYSFFAVEDTMIEGTYFSDTHAYLMEYVDGVSLDELIGVKVDNDFIDAVFPQILEGLTALHEEKLIHRNIKPSSILLGRDGSVKLCDFSLVSDENSERVTDIHLRLGSPQYRAPEYHELNELDPQIDIYAVGVILAEVLKGEKRDKSIFARRKLKYVPRVNLAVNKPLLSTLPHKYHYIVKRATREKKELRYPNAFKMMRDFSHMDYYFDEALAIRSAVQVLEVTENPFYDGPDSERKPARAPFPYKKLLPFAISLATATFTVFIAALLL